MMVLRHSFLTVAARATLEEEITQVCAATEMVAPDLWAGIGLPAILWRLPALDIID